MSFLRSVEHDMPLVPALASERTSPRGRRRGERPLRLRGSELTYVLRNLATLVDNGLSLTRSLGTLAQERSLRRYAPLLEELRRQVEIGSSFSTALARFPDTFSEVMVHQVKVGERSGTLAATLNRIAEQLEGADRIRSQALRKLAYPAVLMVAGVASVSFMLLFVVPVFQRTYAEAGVPLPWITQALIAAADAATSWGWIVPLAAVAAAIVFGRLRQTPAWGYAIDARILRLPVCGEWLRNVCVLEFMDVLGNLLESGFTVAEALTVSGGAIRNRAIRRAVENLHLAVTRGERFSREIDKLGDIFPPVVSQLVVVGEKTGNLAKATGHIRLHLAREIERRTAVLVGTLEPVLTISLAVMIGSILLAIYLPMFDMIGAMNAPPQ